MKGLLLLCLSGFAAAEVPSGYPARGRPAGPRFELPEKTQTPQNRYLPPLDPRNPPNPPSSFGPDTDLSVQGLPDQSPPDQTLSDQRLPGQSLPEQGLIAPGQAEFQRSPVSGAPASGPGLQAGPRGLDEQTRVRQFQAQQENFRQTETHRQTYNSQSTTDVNRIEPTTQRSTEAIDLNQGETLPDASKGQSTVSQQQKVQDYPPEIFLNPLAQLRLAYTGQQYGRLSAGPDAPASQFSAPVFDGLAHLTALPSILAQRAELDQQQLRERQMFGQQNGFVVLSGDQNLAQQYRLQPIALQSQTDSQSGEEVNRAQIFRDQANSQQPLFVQQTDIQQTQYQPEPDRETQFVTRQRGINGQSFEQAQIFAQRPQGFAQQPQLFAQQAQVFAQQPQDFAPQPQLFAQQAQSFPQQPQDFAQQPQVFAQQPQLFAQQPQDFAQQPQGFAQQAQGFAQQPAIYTQPPVRQMVITDYSYTYQPSDGQYRATLEQSRLEARGLEANTDKNNDSDEDKDVARATAVASAFGQRLEPRTQYGTPLTNTGYPAATPVTDNSRAEELTTTESSLTVAQATAVADGGRRKNAKLRSRRPRPLFTVDNSGHLVLARDQ